MVKGIDVSNNNGWYSVYDAVALNDVQFVWCKITEGKTYRDARFSEYARLVLESGKILGAYHFARPDNNSAYEEAEWFVKNIQPYLIDGILIALDWEKGIDGASRDWIAQWMGTVQRLLSASKMPCIYLSYSAYQQWKQDIPQACGLWIASWDVSTESLIRGMDRLVAFHQTGIQSGIDRDVFNGTLEQCRKYMFTKNFDEGTEPSFEYRIEELLKEILFELRRLE